MFGVLCKVLCNVSTLIVDSFFCFKKLLVARILVRIKLNIIKSYMYKFYLTGNQVLVNVRFV